jgi:hypothetical protein
MVDKHIKHKLLEIRKRLEASGAIKELSPEKFKEMYEEEAKK